MEISLVQARMSQATKDDEIVRKEKYLVSAVESAAEWLKKICSEGEERKSRKLKGTYNTSSYQCKTTYSFSESTHDQLRDWLSLLPLSYEEPFHRSQELHENDTNGWIFSSPDFRAWARNEWITRPSVSKRKLGANDLWIQGKQYD